MCLLDHSFQYVINRTLTKYHLQIIQPSNILQTCLLSLQQRNPAQFKTDFPNFVKFLTIALVLWKRNQDSFSQFKWSRTVSSVPAVSIKSKQAVYHLWYLFKNPSPKTLFDFRFARLTLAGHSHSRILFREYTQVWPWNKDYPL
jgi:hypothetical protein